MAQPLMTPGVYIEEKNAFPGSVVEVATAIPAFIGYTEKASCNGKSLLNIPTRITSFAEYVELFGGAFNPLFKLETPQVGDRSKVNIGDTEFAIKYAEDNHLLFYNSIRLFYANGGGTCYIVSVGTYEGKKGIKIKGDQLLGIEEVDNKVVDGGLIKLLKEPEPTLVVIPEAVLLGEHCYDVYKQVLIHCGKMQNRFAIFDLHDGDIENDETKNSNVSRFREGIGSEYLSYGAVYYPWLSTNIVEKGEVTFKNLDIDFQKLKETFLEPKAVEFFKKTQLTPTEKVDQENEYRSSKKLGASDEINEPDLKTFIENLENNFHMGLIATSPSYSALMDELRNRLNQMPAAPAMAGKYTAVDNSRGVWKSPANVSLNSVVKPMVNITHDDQQNLNVDAVSGKSINAIRTFPGVGTLVWGARTLNGNSLDWQYINVRRTIIMLEQSIKLALRSYVFEPNGANTWITVKSMIVNFLTEKWKQGALAGSSPEDAFDVQIGLGATMTGLDILQGKMLVSVKLAIVRPAEFIVVTFQQQMQKS